MANTGRRVYSEWVLVLGAVSLVESLAFSIPYSYFPNYAISLGASVASIGLFTSSFMLASAIMAPKLGETSDRIGRKKIMLWGLLGDVVLGSLTGLVPSWEWLLLIRIANGAATAAVMIPAEALLIDQVAADRRGEATGFVMACRLVGRNLGPAFGGMVQFASLAFVSIQSSYRIPYFVDSAFAALALVLVACKIKEKESRIMVSTIHGNKNVRARSSGRIQISRSLKILFICALANGMAAGFIVPISVLFYQDKFGATPLEIGFIVSLAGFLGLLASWIAGSISDRLGRKPIIALGGISARLTGIALPFSVDLSQATFFLMLRRVGFNMLHPALRALRADIIPEEARGRLFGLYRTFFNIGDIIGPLVATYLYALYRFETLKIGVFTLPGIGVPFFLNAAIGLFTIILLLSFVKEPKRESSPKRKVLTDAENITDQS